MLKLDPLRAQVHLTTCFSARATYEDSGTINTNRRSTRRGGAIKQQSERRRRRPTGDGASDWAANDSETDAVLCSETAGYASLLEFASTDTLEVSQSGRDDEERSFEESFDTALGTSSSPTDTSAMM